MDAPRTQPDRSLDPAAVATRSSIAALVAVGTLGAAPVVIGPVMVGGLIDEFALTARQAGLVFSAEMGGIGIATLLGVFVVHRANRRHLLTAAVLVLLAAYLATSLWVSTLTGATLFAALVATWLVGGLGSGSATSTMKAAVAGVRQPDRVFALYSVTMLSFGAIAVPALTQLRLRHGLLFAYLAMALLTAALLSLARWWPERVTAPVPAAAARQPATDAPALSYAAVAALGFYFLGYSGVWPYAERLGIAAGLAPGEAGGSVGLGLASGGIGAASAAFASGRIQRIHGIVAGLAIAASGFVLLTQGDPAAYRAGVALFLGGSFFGFPFLLGVLAGLDPAGRLIMIGLLAQSVCMAAAPALAATLAVRDFLWVPWQGLACYAACLIASLVVVANAKRAARALT